MQVAASKQNKTFIKILIKYSDFLCVLLKEETLVLPEQTNFNKHIIKLEDGREPSYRQIYSLSLIELETFKAYIETYLKTGFIWFFNYPTDAPILFDKMSDSSFCLYIDY